VGNISVDYDVLNQKGSPAWYSDVYANIPAPGYKGRMFISTDTYAFYRDNGTGWDLVGGPGTGTITGSGASGQVTYFNGSDTIGGSNNLFWDITNARLGIGTATPGSPLDIHSTGTAAQFNGTTTNNAFVFFQNAGTSKWRIGNLYNSGANDYQIYDVLNATARLTIKNTGATTLTGTFTATSLIKSGGTSSQILLADGTTTPTSTFGTGSVTNVSALTLGTTGTDLTSSVVNSTTTPVITLNVPTASATNRGALSSADWTTFNSKQATITLTTTGTSGAATLVGATLNIPNYTNVGTVTSVAALTLGTTGTDLSSSVANSTSTPVITLNVPTASATNRGALSSADWTTFNSKQATISVTAPVVLTGATISMPAATTSVSGYLTSTDWNTFNNKTSNLGTVTDVVALTIGTTGIDITSTAVTTTTTPVITLNIPTASASNRGALSSTDWTTFNNKQATLSLTTTGTNGAATLVANTLNIPNYGSALSGYLPLSGGTLTGPLNGTSASFSGTGLFNGELSVGGTLSADRMFQISGTAFTTGSSQFATVINPTFSGTITNVYGVYAGNNFNTGTITNSYNLYIENTSVGSATVTNRYGIYQSGSSDKNYFSGSVGIGTAAPSYKFHVSNNTNGFISRFTCGTSSDVNIGIFGSTAGAFGSIGTESNHPFNIFTNGTDRLTIATTGAATFSSSVTTGGNVNLPFQGALWWNDDGSSNTSRRRWAIASNYDTYGSLSFKVGTSAGSEPLSGTTVMNITNAGNVGIGTSSPSYKLQIGDLANTSSVLNDIFITGDRVNNDGYYARLIFGNSSQSGGSTASIRGERKTSNYATELTFYTNPSSSAGDGTERMRITSGGDIYVKTAGAGLYWGASQTADIFVSPSTNSMYIEYPTGYSAIFRTQGGTQSLELASTGAATFSSTLGINGTSNNVRSGTYTPTVTAGTNCSAVTAYPCQYMQVDKVVTVSGYVYGSATAVTTETQFTMSTPVNTNFTQVYQCGGTGRSAQGGVAPSGAGYVASISANATNEVRFSYTAPAVLGTGGYFWFSFTYQII